MEGRKWSDADDEHLIARRDANLPPPLVCWHLHEYRP